MNKAVEKAVAIILAILVVLGTGCQPAAKNGDTPTEASAAAEPEDAAYDYGVFIGLDGDLSRCEPYGTVIIDAQCFSGEEIAALTQKGHTVYSYLNIGSVEECRSYYKRFSRSTLGAYANWNGERWMDVSEDAWQRFLLEELVPELLEKGVDGFFVDNCDVYYKYPEPGIYDGLVTVLRGLKATGKQVIINSGDAFLDEYCRNGGSIADIITGIDQESVFSRIDWKKRTFGEAAEADREYFTAYLEKYAAMGAEIYVLEYTADPAVARKAADYCAEHGFRLYITDSLELK